MTKSEVELREERRRKIVNIVGKIIQNKFENLTLGQVADQIISLFPDPVDEEEIRKKVAQDFDHVSNGIGTSFSYHRPEFYKEFEEFYSEMRRIILDPSLLDWDRHSPEEAKE